MNESNADFIWESYDPFNLGNKILFEEDTLIFTIFTLNYGEILNVKAQLDSYIKPFLNYYPWFYSKPDYRVLKKGKVSYIYGEVQYSDNVNDEWLMTALLWEFLKVHPEVYIHLWDSNDEEYLLVQFADDLPSWMSPENSSNRIWLTGGALLLLKPENTVDSLTLKDALDSLQEGSFHKQNELSVILENKMNTISGSYFLSLIFDVTVVLPKSVVYLLASRRQLICRSIKEFNRADTDVERDSLCSYDKDTATVTLGIPFLALSMSKLHVSEVTSELGNRSKSELLGRIIVSGLQILGAYEPKEDDNHALPDISRLLIQNELIKSKKICHIIPEDIAIHKNLHEPESHSNEEMAEEKLLERLKEFMMDTEAGPEGVDNAAKKTPDASVNDVKIDEDDFFEFFLKEALKLNDEEISSYARANFAEESSKKGDTEEYNDDSDYRSDSSDQRDDNEREEEETIKQLIENLGCKDDTNALKSLLTGIKSGRGPLSAILNNLPKQDTPEM